MLISLSVKNLALIENAEVNFGEGLNAFSGETGAGKSLVIGSVNLALGGRAKTDMIRDHESPAEIEIVFSVDNEKDRDLYRDMGIDVEDDGLIVIRRRISDGKNIARINGHTVTNSELKTVSASLIDIHGQSEHQSLLYEKNHLLLLDNFAGEEDSSALADYREIFGKWTSLQEELEDMDTDEDVRKREAELLDFEIKEIEEAGLREGEDDELEDKFRLMNNSKKIAEAVSEAYAAVSSEEGASSLVSRALRAVSGVTGLDKRAEELFSELSEVDSLMNDLQRDMNDYISGLDFSGAEYEAVTTRLNRINELKMKYGRTIPDILRSFRERKERLEVLNNYDERLSDLRAKIARTEKELKKAADILTGIRRSAAVTLGMSVEQELKELNFEDSRFEVNVSPSGSFSVNGADKVSFNISTNPGEDMRPLKDVASGGELSRIMLALKCISADTDETGTMIFDEIDTGISGRTAQKVSESLLRLSKRHQVILITHLPQIAAMADHHCLISKHTEGGRTKTELTALDREGMINELGRMLSGAMVTDNVLNNAREMKDLADKRKE